MESTQQRRDMRGSGSVMVIAVFAAASVMLVGGSQLVVDTISSARARTVADGAALAGAVSGRSGANSVATAGGGTVVVFSSDSRRVVVTASVLGHEASAAAVVPQPQGGVGDRAGLAPAMLAALARADELLGEPVPIVSGYRSRAKQQQLWDNRLNNPYPVAPPGSSRHETGLAVDVPIWFVDRLRAIATHAGLCHPLPDTDPVHFEVCPIQG